MNSGARAVLATLLLGCAGCATVQGPYPGPLTIWPPGRNCDGTELTDLARYEIHFGPISRVASGFSPTGSCDGVGVDDFQYAKVTTVAVGGRSCTLTLEDASNWYVTAVAVTTSGKRSSYSSEVQLSESAPAKVVLMGCAETAPTIEPTPGR